MSNTTYYRIDRDVAGAWQEAERCPTCSRANERALLLQSYAQGTYRVVRVCETEVDVLYPDALPAEPPAALPQSSPPAPVKFREFL